MLETTQILYLYNISIIMMMYIILETSVAVEAGGNISFIAV